MPRRRQLRPLFALTALLAALAVGCSGDDEEPGKAAEERRAGADKAQTAKNKPSKADLATERRALAKEAERDRKADRELDRGFSETPFEKIVGQLPIRKPPLFVEQYITSEGSSTVYTAVARKRFLCGRSPADRKAAVSRFYRDADKLFRRSGVKGFVQIVTPIAETTDRLPALAVARQGSVSLTKRGRAKGRC